MNRFSVRARALCAFCLFVSLSFLIPSGRALAEGFAIMENSARGMGLAGGLIARGGDASTLAYNPAAMTLLDGTQMQANLAVSQFYWGVDTRDRAGNDTGNFHSAHQTWPIPSFYLTHQINDKLWSELFFANRDALCAEIDAFTGALLDLRQKLEAGDEAGLRGLRVGGAQVSQKHTGFIVNAGGATARDVLELMARIQQAVFERSGVRLEPEVRILGEE